jgi:hypothetical protein
MTIKTESTELQLSLVGDPTRPDDQVVRDYLASTEGLTDHTVNSISGGKTSAYMAVRYPARHNVFAVVLTRDPNCRIQDKGLLRAIQDKCPEFEGSRELDQTLRNVLELEQLIGREIEWVWGIPFDDLIQDRSYLPNQRKRFCTEEMKLYPIYQWYLQKIGIQDACEMRVGFRADEYKRVYKILGGKYSSSWGWDWSGLGQCEKLPKSQRRIQWRFVQCPLWMDGIRHPDIVKFWADLGWTFPTVSNCDFCFFHRPGEMIQQYLEHPTRSEWWLEREREREHSFGVKPLQRIFDGDPMPLFDDSDACACTD